LLPWIGKLVGMLHLSEQSFCKKEVDTFSLEQDGDEDEDVDELSVFA